MSDTNAPVYTAKVLDVVEWSPSGWCHIILRFRELSVPLVFDDLCYDPDKRYCIGSDVAFTLTGIAFDSRPTSEYATINYSWSLDLSSFTEDDFPVVPGSTYELHGKVLYSSPDHLGIDCGLVVEFSPGHRQEFPVYQHGECVCVRGHLHIKTSTQFPQEVGRPSLLRPRTHGAG